MYRVFANIVAWLPPPHLCLQRVWWHSGREVAPMVVRELRQVVALTLPYTVTRSVGSVALPEWVAALQEAGVWDLTSLQFLRGIQ